ncbi:hypothetical protein [Acetobacter sp. DsW_063]|uniref:hypothetical protein n=1 Tax=Acetobacter sp. DsW_063 TaxID=1514894 RepID=UPI000A3D3178|nr:hypothetical protein [Acetobacter sp. DsW_063]OUJ13095.1 hypothetical protein HK28_02345 [Acetobacter sp. DsW_063]
MAVPPKAKAENSAPDAGGARVLGHGGGIEAKSGDVIVVCRIPDFRRAGITHKPLAVYADGELTDGQIDAIAADPQFEVIKVN